METFKRSMATLLLACVALTMGVIAIRSAGAQQAPAGKVVGGQTRVSKGGLIITVKGYVIDSACAFRNHLSKPISVECALKCAKAGSPLVILTADGTIYWPISADMPATSQNDKLMSYAGKMVTVTGTPYTRGGSRAIVIEKIEAAESSK